MYQAGIIFDGDDTLWETSVFYKEAKEEFFKKMASLGFNQSEVQESFEKTDVANVARFGFTKKRFPTSMAETYQNFCNQYGCEKEINVERKLKSIGNSVFQRNPLLLDNADYILEQLRPFYKLVLATKGDLEVQKSKIEHSGLKDCFHEIYILDHKTDKEIRQVIIKSKLEVSKSWAVGNSLKSDIKPAMQAGLKAIWIPHTETWAYENDTEPNSSNFYKVSSLSQILEILL